MSAAAAVRGITRDRPRPPGPIAVMAARLSWARRTGRAPGPVRRDSRLTVLDGPTGTTSSSTTAPWRLETP